MRRIEKSFIQKVWIAGFTAAFTLPSHQAFAGGSSTYTRTTVSTSSGVAEQEIIKRLERIERAKQSELEGDRMMRDGNYEGAVSKYQEALAGIPNAPMSAADRGRIIIKYVNAGCLQADKLGKMGRMEEGKALCKALLAEDIDPDNARARELIKRLDDPDYYNPSNTQRHYEDTEKVKSYLKKGLGYYDLGQFNEAEKEFNQILLVDPHNTAARRLLEKTERQIVNYLGAARDHTRAHLLRQVDELWETAVPQSVENIPGGGGSTNDKSKQTPVTMKLRTTIIPKLSFDGASIEEVIGYLRSKSKELDPIDPNKSGVNFILKLQNRPAQTITLDISDVPLLTAVEQVCNLAGLRYEIGQYAVTITTLDGGVGAMETRVFQVPPDFISSASTDAGAAPAEADPFATSTATPSGASAPKRADAKTVLVGMGADFTAAGSSAQFVPGSSRLIVRNTQLQLDFIEGLIDDMRKRKPKQVYITTKFVEVSQRNSDELGFDWLIGAFNAGSSGVFGSGGTTGNTGNLRAVDYPFLMPTSGASPLPVGGNPVTRGLRSGTQAIAQNAIDGLLARTVTSGDISTTSPAAFALAGVFTDPQFQVLMRALSQKKGVDLLTAPSIVTKSGQRAKIEIIREFPYPTDFDPPQIPQDFGNGNNNGGGFQQQGGGLGGLLPGVGGGSVSSFPVTPTTPTEFEFRNTGVSMEVDPVIGEDNYTVDLNLAPEVVEFEGFINYGSPINTGAVNAAGVPTTVILTENRIEQPVFATRKMSTAVTIWDGQTVGVGGLIREDVQSVEDKVPLFGDIPFLGRLFRTKSEEHFKKNLMIYVTAKIIDPAGQRINNQSTSEAPDMSGGADPGAVGALLTPPPGS